MWERLGIKHTKDIENSWLVLIRAGRVRLVDRQSNRISVYEMPIPIHGQEDEMRFAHVVYDSNRKSIVTVLHPEGSRV